MKAFVAILALFVASACGASVPQQFEKAVYIKDIEGRITHGYQSGQGWNPYAVGLSINGNGVGWWCGGSIISNNWVLTAAHCTNNANSIQILFGGTSRTHPTYTLQAGRGDIRQHPSWPNTNGNDIALIKTPYITYGSTVNRIELPGFSSRSNNFANQWALACGWGGTYDGSPMPEMMQCVDLQVMETSECSRTFGALPEGILCVRTPEGKSTCNGDSGGPLVLHNGKKLIGVTSFGGSSCTAGTPAGFTRVTAHLNWIRDNSGVSYN